jgi:hypothetical protein
VLPEFLVLGPNGAHVLSLDRVRDVVPRFELGQEHIFLLVVRIFDVLEAFLDHIGQARDSDFLPTDLQRGARRSPIAAAAFNQVTVTSRSFRRLGRLRTKVKEQCLGAEKCTADSMKTERNVKIPLRDRKTARAFVAFGV